MSFPRSRSTIRRRALLAGASALTVAPSVRAHAQTFGVALVIGNSKYQWETSLPNVRRDAPDIAKRLQSFGLKVELLQDANRDSMRRAIDNLDVAGRGTEFAAVYFAGHGVDWNRAPYLVPIDADLREAGNLAHLIPALSIREATQRSNGSLLVFDSCRNNPADGWRQRDALQSAHTFNTSGVNAWRPAPNSLTLFSTAPGRVALDGPAGQNSPFAAALLRQLDGPSIDLQGLPARLRRDVLIATRGRQVVWDRNDVQQPYFVKGAPSKASAPAIAAADADSSSIVELTNAYTFAKKNGLIAPPGLIAYRSSSASRHARMVGAFSYDTPTNEGLRPVILIVTTTEDLQNAEMVGIARWEGRSYWVFRRCQIDGDTLSFLTEFTRVSFTWKDANSGNVSIIAGGDSGTITYKPYIGRFTRLDG